MRILVAPDKFKGSLTARDVAENIVKGLRDILPNAEITIVSMADGGEGTADVMCHALKGSWKKCNAHDPLGRKRECSYAFIEKRKLAIMDMSEAAGLQRLPPNERDVDRSSTFGVGEMMLDATRQGAKEIIIGLGGSATNDGGFGMARAFGFRFFAGEKELSGAVSELLKLTHVKPSPQSSPSGRRRPRTRGVGNVTATRMSNLSLPKIIAAVDVRNPLLGQNGATRVFGPQKGGTPDKLEMLERALTRLADVVKEELGLDYRNEPGAGAAGGLGFGLMSFCRATIQSGFDVVAEIAELESKVKDVDFVVTGEGCLDRQTLEGKVPAGVAKLARKLGKPVYAIVGRADEDPKVRELFDDVYVLRRAGVSEEESVAHAAQLLRERALELAKVLRATPNPPSPGYGAAGAQRPTSNAQ